MPRNRTCFRRLYDAFAQMVEPLDQRIEKAASWMADSLIDDGFVHLKYGHLHQAAEKAFHRDGPSLPPSSIVR